MRFLLTVQPAFGHFHAMAPLAQALKDHGHEVAFATGKGFGPVIRRTGFQYFPCGLDFDGSQDILTALPEWQAIKTRSPAGAGLEQLYGFVLGLAPRMADDLIPLVETWKPDLIVRDPLEFGGYIAAECCGLPHATVIWASYISGKDYSAEAVLELRQRYGLPDDPHLDSLDRYLVLDFLPASWTFPKLPYPPVAHRFCSPPFDQSSGASLPEWVNKLPDQPTVYATLGTTFNQAPGIFRAILSAFRDEGLNLILTIGRSNDPAQFGPQPEHIKIERYIPQTLILPQCEALIFHGGYNSLLSALWHGLPMVIIPQGAGDQPPTGWRCADLGLGLLVGGNPPEPDAIRRAVKTVLEQPAYKQRVLQMQCEIKQLPGLDQAVKQLETLARDREPQYTG